ncbi:MAG TPA: exosortase A [Chromatiales bacterium]|nr:exosortase A [Chromatiales bacterium]
MARSQWHVSIVAAGSLLIALTALYWQTIASTAAIWWRSDTYAHGMLILPISAYLVWMRRQELLLIDPKPEPLALGILFLLASIWLLADIANVLVLQQLALVLMMPAVVLAIFGRAVVRTLVFPLAYLLFCVPIGESLVPPLQEFTAYFTVSALRLSGIPVYLEGLYFSIPTGNFEVAEACSGIRYLIASIALGFLYAYLTYRSLWRRTLFIALSIIVPILANGVRAYGIVMLAYLSDMKIAVGVDHIIYGWIFFGLVMALLFWLGGLWRENDVKVPAATKARRRIAFPGSTEMRKTVFVGLAAFLVMGSAPVASVLTGTSSERTTHAIVFDLPKDIGGWRLLAQDAEGWAPNYIGADSVANTIYEKQGKQVRFYLAYYAAEEQGAELINSENVLFDRSVWVPVEEVSRSLDLGLPEQVPVREIVLRSNVTSRLVWYWYDIDGYLTNDSIKGKIFTVWQRLMSDDKGSAVFAIAADCDDCNAEQDAMKDFLKNMHPSLISLVRKKAQA